MKTSTATTILMRHGNLRVPCSRYGYDTETCAEVAVRVWELLERESPSEDPKASLEYVMGLVVNDHDDPESTLRQYGDADDHERFEIPMFVAIENTPGYLPDADEPATFETFDQALDYARTRRQELVEAHEEDGLDAADIEDQEDVGEDYANFYVARDSQDLGRNITVERIEA